MEIKIMKNILDRNQNKAGEIRELMKENNVCMINLISSPGAGKTTLLERLCEKLAGRYRTGVIEGDVTTDRDARRLQRFNIPIVVINTEGGGHLDSHSISKALAHFDLKNLDILFVENVGNLICPTSFDLGESFRLAVVSTTEGDDKPAKYPMIFRQANALVLNKTDLIPYTNFNIECFRNDIKKLNPTLPLFRVSATKGEGINEFTRWLEEQLKKT
ncbi:MAG: hydrogenase nickel incorporation protein HypB [Bacteroidales bacterium]|nr:hydrogenase nickel incorporation protein HypB [Bacteroidales bacterium]